MKELEAEKDMIFQYPRCSEIRELGYLSENQALKEIDFEKDKLTEQLAEAENDISNFNKKGAKRI